MVVVFNVGGKVSQSLLDMYKKLLCVMVLFRVVVCFLCVLYNTSALCLVFANSG